MAKKHLLSFWIVAVKKLWKSCNCSLLKLLLSGFFVAIVFFLVVFFWGLFTISTPHGLIVTLTSMSLTYLITHQSQPFVRNDTAWEAS